MKILIPRFLAFSLVLFINFPVFGQISVKEEMNNVQREFYNAKNDRRKADSTVFDSTKVSPIKIEIEKQEKNFECILIIEPVATFEGGMDNFYKAIQKEEKKGEYFSILW